MDPGGVNTVVQNVANSLAENKSFEISILDLNPKEKFHDGLISPSIAYVTLKQSSHRYPVQFWINLLPIYSYLKQEKIELAFVEGTDAGLFVPPLQPFIGTKLIFCDHGALCNQWDNKKATFIRFLASKFCRHTVVLTEKTYQDYIQLFKIKKEKLSIIYNYVECPSASIYKVSSKKIISIGRMTPEKGMDLLIQVASIVLNRHSDWSWNVYGGGPLLLQMRKTTQELHLDKQLFFLGNVENAAQNMNECSICVLPSYREGLPLVLIEALKNLLPAVSFDIETGPRDIIVNGQTGFLISPYRVEEMAEKIEQLISSEDLRMKMSDNCKIQSNKFDKVGIVEQWEKFIIAMQEN